MPQPPGLMLSAVFFDSSRGFTRTRPIIPPQLAVLASQIGGLGGGAAHGGARTFFVRRILGTDRLQMKRGESAEKNHTSEQNHLKSIVVQLGPFKIRATA